MKKLKKNIDIEKLVTWALLNQGLGWDESRKTDSTSEMATYGTLIDRSTIGAPSPNLQTDDDAWVVKKHIKELPDDVSDFIIRFGRIGDRPDWCPEGVGEYVQKRNKKGDPMWIYDTPGNKRSKKHPLMEWQGWRQAQVDYWRSSYTLWRRGLVELIEPLNAEMANHIATPPAAPNAPWEKDLPTIHTPDGPQKPRSRVLTRPEHREEFIEVDGELVPRYR